MTALEMANGLDMAAEAEMLVVNGLAKYVEMFMSNDRDPKTMRALRVYNDAKSNHRRFVKDALDIRTLAIHLADRDSELARVTMSRDDWMGDAKAAWAKYKDATARIAALTEALTDLRDEMKAGGMASGRAYVASSDAHTTDKEPKT